MLGRLAINWSITYSPFFFFRNPGNAGTGAFIPGITGTGGGGIPALSGISGPLPLLLLVEVDLPALPPLVLELKDLDNFVLLNPRALLEGDPALKELFGACAAWLLA